MKPLLANIALAFRTFRNAIWHEYYPLVFAGFFLLALVILQWIFEFDQLYEVIVVNDAGLSLLEKIDFMFEAVWSLFRYADDLTPISLILIAFFQAAIATIWLRARNIKKSKKAAATALGIGVIGAGCVACSSSLLSAIISAVGVTAASVALVQAIGDILLIVAVMLSFKAFVDLGVNTAGHFSE